MMLAGLVLLHGSDARMEWVYFLASILTILLPTAIFGTLTYLLVRAYWRERRAAGAPLPSPKAAPQPGDVG
jgi:hypothetical protein